MKRATVLQGAGLACGAFALGGGGAALAADSAPAAPGDASLDALLARDWVDYHRRHPEAAS